MMSKPTPRHREKHAQTHTQPHTDATNSQEPHIRRGFVSSVCCFFSPSLRILGLGTHTHRKQKGRGPYALRFFATYFLCAVCSVKRCVCVCVSACVRVCRTRVCSTCSGQLSPLSSPLAV